MLSARSLRMPLVALQCCRAQQPVQITSMKRTRAEARGHSSRESSDIASASTNGRRRRKPAATGAPSSKTVDSSVTATAAAVDLDGVQRCDWATMYKGKAFKEYIRYHDEEWGQPEHDDNKLFELLILEGAQAGLSWSTILTKRDAYRAGFDGFDPVKVAAYDDSKIDQLMSDGSGVVRHRGKLQGAVKNAKVFLELQRKHGSFDSYVWSFVPNKQPIVNSWTQLSQVPAKTRESEALSTALKKAGMTFVGPTIMYAFMQAAGLVNDHQTSCHCRGSRAT